MAEQANHPGHLFVGVLIGGALGALAGILFAPKSGKELRSDIREKGNNAFKDVKDIYTDTSTKAKEIIEEAKHEVQELKKDVDRHLSEARQKANEILAHEIKHEKR
jgi:gas vesicle protein